MIEHNYIREFNGKMVTVGCTFKGRFYFVYNKACKNGFGKLSFNTILN